MIKKKDVEFSLSDRTIVVGGTGSGKTTVSKELIKMYLIASKGKIPIYIIDSKLFEGEFDEFLPYSRVHFSEEPPKPFTPNEKTPPIMIWKAPIMDFSDEGPYGLLYKSLYEQRTPCLIFIDELSSQTSQNGQRYPKYLQLIYTQGRALGISVICCTQYVSSFPKIVLTQSSKLIRMNLNDQYDIKKLSSIAGKKIEERPKHQYGFYFKNLLLPEDFSSAVYYKDYKEFFNF